MADFFSAKKSSSSSSSSSASAKSSTPWIEKYRPRTVEEVSHQDDVVRVLKKSLQTGNLPHLLFYGPPGTGKTSTILAICKQLFSPDLYKNRVMELNASDERGINVIRTKVKNFAQLSASYTSTSSSISTSSSSASSSTKQHYPNPPYKIIILDEADSMTADAQAALRRTMETYSKITRFCIICNYISRIIEPLTSRCAKYRFRALENDAMSSRISYIAEQESVPLSKEGLTTLMRVSEGDLRKAITNLQSASTLFRGLKEIGRKEIFEVTGVIPEEQMNQLISSCKSNSFEELQDAVSNLIAEGFSASLIISQLFSYVEQTDELSNVKKAQMAEQIAEADKFIADGADEFLQVLNLASFLMKMFCVSVD